MFILRDLLRPLQAQFSDSELGRERAHWFIFKLLAVIAPFTSSMTSNLLRSLNTLLWAGSGTKTLLHLHGFIKDSVGTPVASHLEPEPSVDGRLLVALDDSINNKSGRNIFGCGFFHDHTAKLNQPSYPWSQNIVCIGLLKIIKDRWSCLPLAFRFYFMKKDIDGQKATTKKAGITVAFQSKDGPSGGNAPIGCQPVRWNADSGGRR